MTDNLDEIRAGVEIEYPLSTGVKFQSSGGDSRRVGHEMEGIIEHDLGGEVTTERIGGRDRGTELRTSDGGIPFEYIEEWYVGVLDEVNERTGHEMEPTGLYESTSAGIHFHLSPISESKAKDLYRLSQEPWMHVFCCSSLAKTNARNQPFDKYPVMRSGDGGVSNYCRMDFSRGHSSVVNQRGRSRDMHYAWRLPEPMTREHFGLLVEFVARFIEDVDGAAEWAHDLVMSGDERLTSIQRANAIGADILVSPDKNEVTNLLAEICGIELETASPAEATV